MDVSDPHRHPSHQQSRPDGEKRCNQRRAKTQAIEGSTQGLLTVTRIHSDSRPLSFASAAESGSNTMSPSQKRVDPRENENPDHARARLRLADYKSPP